MSNKIVIKPEVNVLFVCMGNICRSPTAEGVFASIVKHKNITGINIDSAGTHDYHIGKAPDSRAIKTAKEFSYDLSLLRARQVNDYDFFEFNYILAMDRDNLAILKELKPIDWQGHLSLLLDFHPSCKSQDVPDPYFGGQQGFTNVISLIEKSCDGLLNHLM